MILALILTTSVYAKNVCIDVFSGESICTSSITLSPEISEEQTEYCISYISFYNRSNLEAKRQSTYLAKEYSKLEKKQIELSSGEHSKEEYDLFYNSVMIYNKKAIWLSKALKKFELQMQHYNSNLCDNKVVNNNADIDKIYSIANKMYLEVWK
jgi:hypothetical protein